MTIRACDEQGRLGLVCDMHLVRGDEVVPVTSLEPPSVGDWVIILNDPQDGIALQLALPVDDTGWVLGVELVRRKGQVETRRVQLLPHDGATGFSQALLRQVDVRALPHLIEDMVTSEIGAAFLKGWAETRTAVARPGRRGRPAVEYALWAKRVVDRADEGSASPIKDLCEEHSMNRKTLQGILKRAEDLGLYKPKGAGKPGGKLLPRAERLLAGTDLEPKFHFRDEEN